MVVAEAIIISIVIASTPLLLAALGELVAERAGVLNLGVEGMMIMGAVCGFIATVESGQPLVGVIAAILAGMLMACLFAFVTLVLVANQVASGLALTLLGTGLSGLIGESYASLPGIKIPKIYIPGLTDIPFVGKILFGEDPLVYVAAALTIGVSWFLFRTRGGLIVRAVGDNHTSAHALGYSVQRVRFMAILFGGACAGLDCARPGRLRHVAALPAGGRGTPVRGGGHPAVPCAGARRAGAGPVPVEPSLRDHHPGAGAHFREPAADAGEYARHARTAFCAGPMRPSRRPVFCIDKITVGRELNKNRSWGC
jgi:ABC-type uncharacterized transport system permease subunit